MYNFVHLSRQEVAVTVLLKDLSNLIFLRYSECPRK